MELLTKVYLCATKRENMKKISVEFECKKFGYYSDAMEYMDKINKQFPNKNLYFQFIDTNIFSSYHQDFNKIYRELKPKVNFPYIEIVEDIKF